MQVNLWHPVWKFLKFKQTLEEEEEEEVN